MMDDKNVKIFKVGHTEDQNSQVLRITHISDTHMMHDDFLQLLPPGDILIHSGDFAAFSVKRYFGNKRTDRESVMNELDTFFSKVPYKHKIFVPGNHELSFTEADREFIEKNLKNVTYLQDSVTEIEGLKIYGSPWTFKRWVSFARGFAERGSLKKYWEGIPDDTDILVTHLPPQGIMDLARKKPKCCCGGGVCDVCDGCHGDHEHWGCPFLREAVQQRVKPTIHMFGHVHEGAGIQQVDNVTFSNAAMKLAKKVNVFDYYKSKG